jgi:hypothetical protein
MAGRHAFEHTPRRCAASIIDDSDQADVASSAFELSARVEVALHGSGDDPARHLLAQLSLHWDLVARVVAGAHERAGFDVFEAERKGL